MKFDRREWVNDIAATSITGLIAGAIGALFIPDPPLGMATTAGGIAGFLVGLLNQPIRTLLNWLRGNSSSDSGDSK